MTYEYFCKYNKKGDYMIQLYTDLIKKGYNDYQIKKLVAMGDLFMIKKGVYSTEKQYDYLEYIAKKHSNAIFTLETACYCYGLIKQNNPPYKIATKQKDRKIHDEKIKQIFMTTALYDIGASKITYHGFNIMIYDLERLLIEVARFKISLDYDLYHEIITSYKRLSKLLNKKKIEVYLSLFKDSKIKKRIMNDVFSQ